jgi:hypothetical protein
MVEASPCAAALAFLDGIFADWTAAPARLWLPGGDELVVLVREPFLIATAETGFQFAASGGAVVLRTRRHGNGWRVIGFSDSLDELLARGL